jgi:cellulose biosynthesis protein BcsQ
MLANLTQNMMKAAEIEEDMHQDDDYEWPRNEQLLRLLREHDIPDQYDVVICDPQATEGDALYNAIYATRSILLPVELSGKGALSIDGLTDLAEGLEAEVGIDVGVLGIVPVAYKATNTQQEHLAELEASKFDVPVVFGERSSLMQEMWESQATAFRVVEEGFKEGEPGQRRRIDRENETLEQYRNLASHVEGEFK